MSKLIELPKLKTTPMYLSGAIHSELMDRPGRGFIVTPFMGNRIPDGQTWAADNGCFTHGGVFDEERYLSWLATRDAASCLFATAPDVVGDAVATMARSLPVLPKLRQLGYKAALVAQDGLENLEVPWNEIDALFIGGSTEWKLSAAAAKLVAEAKARGKWVHMGRVNSFKRLRYAGEIGCDSADGTFVAFAPAKNVVRLEAWFQKLTELQKVAA